MAEVVSRHQAMANAMDAERQLATDEAKSGKPDNELSAAARALSQAARDKRSTQHPREAAQEQELPADEEETAAPAEGEDQGDPNAEGDELAVGQAIVVNGKRLTADEIARDFVPKAEFTRKTQAHAERERQFQQVARERLQRLDQQIEALNADVGQEPDWVKIATEEGNDVAFSKRIAWEQKSRKLQLATQISQQESQQLVAQQIAERDADLADNYNPAWQNSKTRDEDYEKIAQYAFSEGFTPQETALMTASRYLRTLDKARQWDEAMKAGKLAKPGLAKKPAVMKPGARNPQTVVKNPAYDKALEQFNKNPSREGWTALETMREQARRAN